MGMSLWPPSFWPTLYVSLDDFVYVLCNFVVFGLVAWVLQANWQGRASLKWHIFTEFTEAAN